MLALAFHCGFYLALGMLVHVLAPFVLVLIYN